MTTVAHFHRDGKMNSYETHMQVYPSVTIDREYEKKTVLPREDVNLTHLSFLSVWLCVIAEHTSVPLLASISCVYEYLSNRNKIAAYWKVQQKWLDLYDMEVSSI